MTKKELLNRIEMAQKEIKAEQTRLNKWRIKDNKEEFQKLSQEDKFPLSEKINNIMKEVIGKEYITGDINKTDLEKILAKTEALLRNLDN